MTNEKRLESLEGVMNALQEMVEASLEVTETLDARIGNLEEAFLEFTSDSAEEEFMEERQRWIDTCRERAAEKRRTS